VTQPLFRERGSAEESPETPASPEAPVSERASVAAPNVLLGAAAHERSAADVWLSMGSTPSARPMSLMASHDVRTNTVGDPATDDEPLFTVFVADERQRTNAAFARREAQEDSVRIKSLGAL
jgi:hypothetical protein